MTLRMLTAGESHGRGLVAVLEGMPRGLEVSTSALELDLARRRRGYGRSPRMKLERDEVRILAGVRDGVTMGSPLALWIENSGSSFWEEAMSFDEVPPEAMEARAIRSPRPGHADLPGCLKFLLRDAREVAERASARSTAARVACGSVCRLLLKELGVEVQGAVCSIGRSYFGMPSSEEEWERAFASDMGLWSSDLERTAVREIEGAAQEGDSLGGTFWVRAKGVPPGLGSLSEWDRRLDARLAFALMSIPSVKGVEVGMGFALSSMRGSEAHDAFVIGPHGPRRTSNRSGGIDGGLSNGEDILLRASLKPIPTIPRSLQSFDVRDMSPSPSHSERADVCAVPAACVVGEAMVCLVLASVFLEEFGGGTLLELKERVFGYRELRRRWFEGVR